MTNKTITFWPDIQVNYKLRLWTILLKLLNSIDQRKGDIVMIKVNLYDFLLHTFNNYIPTN